MSMLFLDQNFMLFPTVNLFFAVSLILFMYRKLFTEALLAFNLQTQQLRLSLQENKVRHSKEP